jgi:hypothetical protein
MKPFARAKRKAQHVGPSALSRNSPAREPYSSTIRIGGADRDRTGDPLLAKQVLSQLSYSPMHRPCNHGGTGGTDLVGLGRFELPTSPLSGVRSNQLSYRPIHRRRPATNSAAFRIWLGHLTLNLTFGGTAWAFGFGSARASPVLPGCASLIELENFRGPS